MAYVLSGKRFDQTLGHIEERLDNPIRVYPLQARSTLLLA